MGFSFTFQDPFAAPLPEDNGGRTDVGLPRERATYECIVRTCTTGQYQRPQGSGISRHRLRDGAEIVKLELCVEVIDGQYAGARVWTDLPFSEANQRDYAELTPGVQWIVQRFGILLDRIIYVASHGRAGDAYDYAAMEARVRVTLEPDEYEVRRAEKAIAEGKRGKMNPFRIVDVERSALRAAPQRQSPQPPTFADQLPQMQRRPSRPVTVGQSLQLTPPTEADIARDAAARASYDDEIPF